MSESQHPQSEGTESSANRSGNGTAGQSTGYAPLDSLAAVGARLAQLREAKGWSVDDVSARLKVSPNKMRSLESGDISQLPGATFALGVVRSYAKMLGTDPEPFAQALRREKGELEPDLSMPASTGTDLPRGRVSVSLGGTPKHRSWWWGVAAVVVGLAALVMWHSGGESSAWFARLKASANGMASNPSGASSAAAQGQVASVGSEGAPAASGAAASSADAQAQEASGAVAVASDAAGESAQAAQAAPAETGVASQTAATAAPAASQALQAMQSPAAPASAPMQASAAKAGEASAAAAPGSQSTIVVKVTQDSWFSVRDKNGKEVFSGLVHAGDAKEVSGEPPFKVTAGNRAGLESLTLDGQPVDAAKYGASKGNVARFSLP
jgi:cytoskeleton protein RodZ